MPRAQRRRLTARLLGQAADVTGERREWLLNQVVEINIGVAHAIARRYDGRSVPLEDLEQVACVALVRAAQKFDVSQERDFLTYAVPTISGEIKRYFRDHGWTIRPPRRIQEIQSRVIQAYQAGHDGHTGPSPVKIAEQLGLPESDVAEALAAEGCFHPASLDVALSMGGEDGTRADRLPADEQAILATSEVRLLLGPVLRKLSPEEREILHMRFVRELTQEQIGNVFGITQMQVSRRLKGILRKLRERLEDAPASA
jgi:RNA polymerase sigma-B factor